MLLHDALLAANDGLRFRKSNARTRGREPRDRATWAVARLWPAQNMRGANGRAGFAAGDGGGPTGKPAGAQSNWGGTVVASGRLLYVALFAWACSVNWQTAIERPRVYLEYADLAVVDLYREFIRGFFAAHIPAIVGTIATCQGLIAAALFAGGKPARVALVGAIVFLVMIAPLGVGSGFPATVIMAVGCVRLLLSPAAIARSVPEQLANALVARRAERRWRRAEARTTVERRLALRR